MAKPLAVGLVKDRYGVTEVPIHKSKASASGDAGAQHYAPGWRPMAFKSVDAAKAKLEKHPGFQGWAERSEAQKEASRQNGKASKGPRDT